MHLSRVDLPQPLCPARTTTVPSSISRSHLVDGPPLSIDVTEREVLDTEQGCQLLSLGQGRLRDAVRTGPRGRKITLWRTSPLACGRPGAGITKYLVITKFLLDCSGTARAMSGYTQERSRQQLPGGHGGLRSARGGPDHHISGSRTELPAGALPAVRLGRDRHSPRVLHLWTTSRVGRRLHRVRHAIGAWSERRLLRA